MSPIDTAKFAVSSRYDEGSYTSSRQMVVSFFTLKASAEKSTSMAATVQDLPDMHAKYASAQTDAESAGMIGSGV